MCAQSTLYNKEKGDEKVYLKSKSNDRNYFEDNSYMSCVTIRNKSHKPCHCSIKRKHTHKSVHMNV